MRRIWSKQPMKFAQPGVTKKEEKSECSLLMPLKAIMTFEVSSPRSRISIYRFSSTTSEEQPKLRSQFFLWGHHSRRWQFRFRIDEWPMEKIVDTINMNLLFSTGLIHALLPVLRNRRGKSLIVNVGSIAGTFGHPRLALYCACKSFSRMFANALDIDERQFTSTNVQYMYLNVGEVSTRSLRKPVTFVRPDPDTFGKAVVDRLGCGRREVTPYVLHAMHCWFLSAVGEYFAEQMVTAKMRKNHCQSCSLNV